MSTVYIGNGLALTKNRNGDIVLEHSAKGTTWKNHRYIEKKRTSGGKIRYVYPTKKTSSNRPKETKVELTDRMKFGLARMADVLIKIPDIVKRRIQETNGQFVFYQNASGDVKAVSVPTGSEMQVQSLKEAYPGLYAELKVEEISDDSIKDVMDLFKGLKNR